MKIGVVGAEAVGSASLLSVVMRGTAREIVVVNRDRKRATAVGPTSNTAHRCHPSSIEGRPMAGSERR
jgi:malate/lactate dehydrogenase